LDTISGCLAFHFRECVFIFETDSISGEMSLVREERSPPVARKGRRKYAEEVLSCFSGDILRTTSTFLVVGDGEGDVRFWRHLSSEVTAKGLNSSVVGLFIDHDDYGDSRNFTGELQFFDTWNELSDILRQFVQERSSCLVLMDVDRTAILPRARADEDFMKVRTEAVICYLETFRCGSFSKREIRYISDLIEYMAENLYGYNAPADSFCFKNEEAVAIGVLLAAAGCIGREWVLKERANSQLDDLVLFSLRRVQERVWLSGLGEANLSGHDCWYAPALETHLSSVSSRIRKGAPVLSLRYRLCEARIIDHLLKESGVFFNDDVLRAVKSGSEVHLAFMSDRPAISLGLNVVEAGGVLGSIVGSATVSRLYDAIIGA